MPDPIFVSFSENKNMSLFKTTCCNAVFFIYKPYEDKGKTIVNKLILIMENKKCQIIIFYFNEKETNVFNAFFREHGFTMGVGCSSPSIIRGMKQWQ